MLIFKKRKENEHGGEYSCISLVWGEEASIQAQEAQGVRAAQPQLEKGPG